MAEDGGAGVAHGVGDCEDRMTEKPWIANGPEQRLSIAVNRFLERALLPPCYFVANQDADGGGRTDNQRQRDSNRGIKSGQLDWEVEQGRPHLMRRLELKRGRNTLTARQQDTMNKLSLCGAHPVVAWTLEEVYEGLAGAGFRFAENVSTILQHLEAQLEAWDREAENVKTGTTVKKRTYRPPSPRGLMPKRQVAAARAKGILI